MEATRSLLENTNLLVEILNDQLVKKHRHIKHLKKQFITDDNNNDDNEENIENNENNQNNENIEKINYDNNNDFAWFSHRCYIIYTQNIFILFFISVI